MSRMNLVRRNALRQRRLCGYCRRAQPVPLSRRSRIRNRGFALPSAPWPAKRGSRFPAARPDGGPVYLGDAPGRLRADADAGAADAGPADRVADADGGSQPDEVRRLRERVTALEQQLARANASAQTRQLEELNQQVATLREQLAQEQARRQQEELAAQQGKAREQEATAALAAAQQQLATGDYRALDRLESVSGLPAPVQSAVQSARTAVQNRDLAAARYWLSIALAEEQRRLLTH